MRNMSKARDFLLMKCDRVACTFASVQRNANIDILPIFAVCQETSSKLMFLFDRQDLNVLSVNRGERKFNNAIE